MGSRSEGSDENRANIAGRIHIPLLREICRDAGVADDDLLKDLRDGFLITGELRTGGNGIPCPDGRKSNGRRASKFDTPSMKELKNSCVSRISVP